MIFAYADPPYYKQGAKRYKEKHQAASDWDSQQRHLDLIEQLNTTYADGWALSCNPSDLVWMLPATQGARICVWTKTFHQIRRTTVQYAYEVVLIKGGRSENARKPMVRDWITGVTTRKKGLVGAKPHYFNLWVLDLLNVKPGDVLIDLYPGTNGMAEALKERNIGKGGQEL